MVSLQRFLDLTWSGPSLNWPVGGKEGEGAEGGHNHSWAPKSLHIHFVPLNMPIKKSTLAWSHRRTTLGEISSEGQWPFCFFLQSWPYNTILLYTGLHTTHHSVHPTLHQHLAKALCAKPRGTFDLQGNSRNTLVLRRPIHGTKSSGKPAKENFECSAFSFMESDWLPGVQHSKFGRQQ